MNLHGYCAYMRAQRRCAWAMIVTKWVRGQYTDYMGVAVAVLLVTNNRMPVSVSVIRDKGGAQMSSTDIDKVDLLVQH